MSDVMYWLDVDGDRTGLEVMINDIPAERMLRTAGIHFPINEYLVDGPNTVQVRRGPWPSNGSDADAGKISVKVMRYSVRDAALRGGTEALSATADFTAAPAMQMLFNGTFSHDGPAYLKLARLLPISPDSAPDIIRQLSMIADIWRAGDGAGIAKWMSAYIRDYVDAYPLETHAAMVERVERMANALAGARIEFDPAAVRFQPVGGGRLIEALGPNGAAVRAHIPGAPVYDMWSVFGSLGGQPFLFR